MSEWKETEIGILPIEWNVGSFRDDLKVQGRIGWKGYKTSDLVSVGPYVIGGTEIKSSIFLDIKNAQCITREKYEESPEIMLQEGDVLIVTRGNLGEIGYYHKIYGEGTINPSVIILNKFKGDSKFLFYYLISKQGKANVMSLESGSSVPAIYQADIKTLKYPKPPIEEQKDIANIVFSIDKKIDLLHRQNQTLEKMAETLFRQWFLEEAKEEWKMGILADLFILQRGFDLPIQNRIQGIYPIYASSGESGFHKEYKVKGPGVTTGRSGVLGNVFFINEDFWPLNTSLFIKEYKKSSPLHSYFVLKSIDLSSFNAGSAVPTLNRNHVHELPIEIPPVNLIQDFDKMAIPLYKKIKSNQTQILTLTALRNTLLPKLMSGEVMVK